MKSSVKLSLLSKMQLWVQNEARIWAGRKQEYKVAIQAMTREKGHQWEYQEGKGKGGMTALINSMEFKQRPNIWKKKTHTQKSLYT